MANFIDILTTIGGLTHYYPLTDAYGGADQWGATTAAPATKGTNYRDFVNQGTATTGAVFSSLGVTTGRSASAWLKAPTHRDFSLQNKATGACGLTIFFISKTPGYKSSTPGKVNDQKNYFMSLGCSTSVGHSGAEAGTQTQGDYEWTFRRYGDPGEQGRHRGTSCYYYDPNPYAIGGSGGLGSGTYIQPAQADCTSTLASLDLGRVNAPVHYAEDDGWSFTAVTMAYDGTTTGTQPISSYSGTFTVNPTTGAITLRNDFRLSGTRSLQIDTDVDPVYSGGDVYLGKRGDDGAGANGGTGTYPFTIARLGFFAKTLNQTDLTTIYNSLTLADGAAAPGSPGGSVAGFVAGTPSTTAGSTLGSVDVAAPAIPVGQTHCIAVTVNAGTPTPTTPTNYTLLSSGTHNGTTNAGTYLYYRTNSTATAFPAATVTVALGTGITGRIAAAPFMLTNAQPTPFETPIFTAGAVTTSVTPAAANEYLLTIAGTRTTATASAVGIDPPAGPPTPIEIIEAATSNVNAVANVAVSVNAELVPTTTATGTRTFAPTQAGASGTIAVMVKPVLVAKVETLVDPFTTFDTNLWTRTSATDVTASVGSLNLSSATGVTNNVLSVNTYTLVGSALSARVQALGGIAKASLNFGLQSVADTTKDLVMRVNSDTAGALTLVMGTRTAAVFDGTPTTITYDSTMPYLRIIEASGSVKCQTSQNGTTWTDRATITSPAWINSAKVYITTALGAGMAGSAVSSISSLNGGAAADPTPSVDVFSLSTLNDQFASADTTKWNFGTSTATVSAGTLRVPTGVAETRLRSRNYWNLRDSFIEFSVQQASGGVGAATYLTLEDSATTGTGFRVSVATDGTVSAGLVSGGSFSGSPVTFALPAGGRLRIREGLAKDNAVSGRIYVDSGVYSAAAQTYLWTQQIGSGVASPAWVTSTRVIFATKNASGTSSDGIFDNVNVDPVNPAAPVPPITDGFDTAVSATTWSSYGTPTVVSGALVLDGVEGIVSKGRINLTGARQYANLLAVTTAAGAVAYFRLEQDSNNALQFKFANGTCFAQTIVSGTVTDIGNVTFNATATKYIQIREAAGKTYFEYGSSPSAMTLIGAAINNPIAVTSLLVRLERSA